MVGEFVPIILFVALAAVAIVLIVYAARARRDQQETLRHAISAGQQLDADTIALLAKPPRAPELDMRAGIIMGSLALGLLGCAAVLAADTANENGALVFAILGILVGSVAAGQLAAWKAREALEHKRQSAFGPQA